MLSHKEVASALLTWLVEVVSEWLHVSPVPDQLKITDTLFRVSGINEKKSCEDRQRPGWTERDSLLSDRDQLFSLVPLLKSDSPLIPQRADRLVL